LCVNKKFAAPCGRGLPGQQSARHVMAAAFIPDLPEALC